MTPCVIRKEKAGEVFTFMRRYSGHIRRDKEINGEVVEFNGRKVLKRKAKDDWF